MKNIYKTPQIYIVGLLSADIITFSVQDEGFGDKIDFSEFEFH